MTYRTRLMASALALAITAVLLPEAIAAGEQSSINAQDIASLVQTNKAQPISMSVYATGLNNPRGLKFGPDGYLYVAEGGIGGTQSTTAQQCQQVPSTGPGPYTGSRTSGRISKIDRLGHRTTVNDLLPSSQTNPQTGATVAGVADIAFIDHTMYALLAGAGCSHGVLGTDNAVMRISPNGAATMIANLSAYQKTHPVQNPNPGDFEPDGTWYSMLAVDGNLYALEPNHGELVEISPVGSIHRVVDISASQGHIVPTALAYHGHFFIGNLNTFPIVDGTSKVLELKHNGQLQTAVNGLTTVLGLAFDRRDRMYVLENTTGNPFPTPGTGTVVRINHSGLRENIITGLTVPTAMTFGPDGALYVSNVGFGFPPTGLGQVLRFDLGDCGRDALGSQGRCDP